MEIILALLTYLTATLTPIEFLFLSALIGLISVLVAKWAIKNKTWVLKLFGRGGNDELDELKKKIEKLPTKNDLDQALSKLEMTLKFQISENDKSIENLTQKFAEISELRQEIIDNEFDELKESLTAFSAQGSQMITSLNESSLAQARLSVQIEHIDSNFKAGIIEFRGYHRELSQDLKTLGRDLALIERSFDLKINNGSAVKLR